MIRIGSFYLLIILALTSFSVFGQEVSDSTIYYKLLSNSYQLKWTYFSLPDTIDATVVKHERRTKCSDDFPSATLTIVKIHNDTIRVLDLFNNKDYSSGQRVKVIPKSEPQFQVHIPCFTLVSGQKLNGQKKQKQTKQHKEEQNKILQKELSIWHSNDFDENILKTTWGQIINN